MSRRENRLEQGSALLIAVLMLVLMGLIGIAALDAVTRDGQVAGYLNRKKVAFFAAEAGVAEALETLNNNLTPTVGQTTLSDTALYPYGRPSYRLDPTVTDPIDNIGFGAASGMNLSIGQGGAPGFQVSYWRVNVQGDAPGGTVARIEIESGALFAN
jgi:Tfp pilus assembly protein PilX